MIAPWKRTLRLYLESLAVERGLSQNTVDAYRYAMAAADFDHDGNLDVVTASPYNDTCSLLMGNGDGSFANSVSLPCGVAAGGVGTADFDGDGLADIAACDRSTPRI